MIFDPDHRSWGAMNAIGQALSLAGFRRCGCLFCEAARRAAGDSLAIVCPQSGRSLREADPAQRLVFAGDPRRSIPPCSACHGPGGYKLGAPALQGQQVNYIEVQLVAFAQGLRQNDISEQMRIIARQLTPDDMHAVAAFYGVPAERQRVVVGHAAALGAVRFPRKLRRLRRFKGVLPAAAFKEKIGCDNGRLSEVIRYPSCNLDIAKSCHFQAWRDFRVMSALPPKADIG